MLILPEIETVIILTPRCASRAIIEAARRRYPKAMLLYRHMEADGVPFGYDRWRRVGLVRDPVDRLWSLYSAIRIGWRSNDPVHARLLTEAAHDFDHWLLHNEIALTEPFSRGRSKPYFPEYAVRHRLPENRKSQFVYLRPDLGTDIFKYSHIQKFEFAVGLRLERGVNAGPARAKAPSLSPDAEEHFRKIFAWDLEASAAP